MQSNSHPKDKDRAEFWHEKSLKWLDLKLWCVLLVSALEGHNQLMHMRITYHFLADLHVTRHVHARETESEKHPEYLNKPCGDELQKLQVKIMIIDPRSCQSAHFLWLCCIPYSIIIRIPFSNSPIDVSRKSQTSTNTSDRGEKWHKAWIIVEGSRSRKFDFSDIYATIVSDLFPLIFWSTHVSHLFFSCIFLWILCLTEYDKIML